MTKILHSCEMNRPKPQVQPRSQVKSYTCQPYHGGREHPRSLKKIAGRSISPSLRQTPTRWALWKPTPTIRC